MISNCLEVNAKLWFLCFKYVMVYGQNTKYIISKFLHNSQIQSSLSATHIMHILQVL